MKFTISMTVINTVLIIPRITTVCPWKLPGEGSKEVEEGITDNHIVVNTDNGSNDVHGITDT